MNDNIMVEVLRFNYVKFNYCASLFDDDSEETDGLETGPWALR